MLDAGRDPAPLDPAAPPLDHPALAADLEHAALLRDAALRPRHLAREQQRVSGALRDGGFGFATAHALVLVRALPWDTAHFGVACADLTRVYVADGASAAELDALLDATVAEARRRGVQLLAARVPAAEARALHALEQRGFRLVDTSVEVGGALPLAVTAPPTGHVLREGRGGDREALVAIAGAFIENRFHHDPRIPAERARAVYTRWVEAALAGERGRLVVVEVAGHLAGFTTYLPADPQLAVAVIGLVAVSPTQRGRGLLAALIGGASVQVTGRAICSSTQVQNAAALRGFARAGMHVTGARHVLHGWL